MRLDRLDRYEQLFTCLSIGVATGDEPQDLTLTIGQLVELRIDVADRDRRERIQNEARETG